MLVRNQRKQTQLKSTTEYKYESESVNQIMHYIGKVLSKEITEECMMIRKYKFFRNCTKFWLLDYYCILFSTLYRFVTELVNRRLAIGHGASFIGYDSFKSILSYLSVLIFREENWRTRRKTVEVQESTTTRTLSHEMSPTTLCLAFFASAVPPCVYPYRYL